MLAALKKVHCGTVWYRDLVGGNFRENICYFQGTESYNVSI